MPTLAASAKQVPQSRIREIANAAMRMDGVLKLYFGESNVPTPEYIKHAAVKALDEGYTYNSENAGLSHFPTTGHIRLLLKCVAIM